RPWRIEFQARGHDSCGLHRSPLLQHDAGYRKCAEQRQKDHTDVEITFHAVLLNRTVATVPLQLIEETICCGHFISTRVLDFKERVEYCRAHFRWEAKLPFGPQSGLPLSYMHRGKQDIVF